MLLRTTLLILFPFLLLVSPLPAGADDPVPQPQVTDVFPPGLNGVARYRIPGMVVSTQGTVLAYCEARRNDSKDWGEIEIHLRRSTDGGITWLPAQQIAHHGPRIEGNPRKPAGGEHEQTVNNPVAVVDSASGAVTLLYCINYARCFRISSSDDGITWSQPTEITPSFSHFRQWYDWKVIATGPGHGIQLTSGRMLVPIWLAFGEVGDHGPAASGTIYSDDAGITWQAGDIVMPNNDEFISPNESILAELPDGRVMMATRNNSLSNRKLVAWSKTGISDWSTPVFHNELWEPRCMASLCSHPSGVLMFSNPATLPLNENGEEIPAGRGRRRNLTIRLSMDNGRSWPVRRTLESGPSAYSDLAVLPDHDVLCLFERNESIACARFTLNWVRQK